MQIIMPACREAGANRPPLRQAPNTWSVVASIEASAVLEATSLAGAEQLFEDAEMAWPSQMLRVQGKGSLQQPLL